MMRSNDTRGDEGSAQLVSLHATHESAVRYRGYTQMA